MPKTPNPAPYGGRLRVTTYLLPEAWEAFAHIALESGNSMSSVTAALIHKYLDQRGYDYDREDAKGRSTRSDFKPAATLAGALTARRSALEQQAVRLTAKLEKVKRLKGAR